MKATDPDKPIKITLSYLPWYMIILIAFLLALIVVRPAEEYIFLGMISKWFYKPFVGMFTICMVCLILVNEVTISLDQKFRWEEQVAKRTMYQLIIGWVIPVLVSFIIAKWYFGWVGIDVMKTIYSRHMYVAILGLPLIINFCYAFFYLFYFFRLGVYAAKKLEKGQAYPDELIFRQSGKDIIFKATEIAYVYVRGKETTIQTHNGEPVCLKLVPLKKVRVLLTLPDFCQVNKSYIISRNAYVKHHRHQRGIRLFLRPEPREPVVVSRYKAGMVLNFLDKLD